MSDKEKLLVLQELILSLAVTLRETADRLEAYAK